MSSLKLGEFTVAPVADAFDQSSGRRKPKRKRPLQVYRPKGSGKAYVYDSNFPHYLQEQGLEAIDKELMKEGLELVFMLKEVSAVNGEKCFRPYLFSCSFVRPAGTQKAHILVFKGEKRLPKVVSLDSLFIKKPAASAAA